MNQQARIATPQLSMNNDWQRWIAENLLLDTHPDAIVATLIAHGFNQVLAVREVQQAVASPYLQGAHQGGTILRNRLRKREWVLDIYRKLNRQRPNNLVLERRHQLTRGDFYRHYYFNNRPVIITGMMDDWQALRRWNFEFLRNRFGEREVEIQVGRDSDANYEINSPQHKRTLSFGRYVDMVEQAGHTNDFYMTANNGSRNKEALAELWQDIGPLNEYLDSESDHKGFFWFGPAGTRTPFHHDLTNNFMAQVMGRKRVKLIPACELANVYNQTHSYTPVDGQNIDYERFPAMQEAQVLECVLEPGEILFLPVGCWHYVEALDPSVTLSFINFLFDNDYSSFYSTYDQV